MIDITHKNNTYREAVAQAIVKVGRKETIDAVRNRTVPKGDVLEMSRAAGLLGVKQTPSLLPDCHPLPIEHASVEYELLDDRIEIRMRIATIYKTGVEVEAMHGASIVALNIYDMLKPIDKEIEILHIKLLTKKGGKSDFKDKFRDEIKAAVVVCSDTISAGKKEDKAGKAIVQKLEKHNVSIHTYTVIPDEADEIKKNLEELHQKVNLMIYTGGTGLSIRDVTPESISPLLDRHIPGIEEQIRRYGQERMPYAMLSRSVAGVKGNCLVLALPGSTAGASESMDAIMPHVLHIFKILKGARH